MRSALRTSRSWFGGCSTMAWRSTCRGDGARTVAIEGSTVERPGWRGLPDAAASCPYPRAMLVSVLALRGCGGMADAHGSGPCGGNPVKVQLLSPAPYVLRAAPGHRDRFAWRAGPGVAEPAVRAASKPSGGPRRPLDSGEATTCQTLGTLRTEGVAASGRPVRSGRSHKPQSGALEGGSLCRGSGCASRSRRRSLAFSWLRRLRRRIRSLSSEASWASTPTSRRF